MAADRPDDIVFRDPRHAVGLGVDVLRLGLASAPSVALEKKPEIASAIRRCQAAAERFVRAPRTVIRGARRKGARAVYRELAQAVESAKGLGFDNSVLDALWLLAYMAADLAVDAMEGDDWRAESDIPSERWREAAVSVGVDPWVIEMREVEWRYRDLVDRKRRGKDMRAAFEAAWLAGERDFAERLLKEAR